MEKLSSCSQDCVVQKTKNIYYLALFIIKKKKNADTWGKIYYYSSVFHIVKIVVNIILYTFSI